MRFKQFIREESHATVSVRALTEEELRLAKEGQRLAKILHVAIKLGKKITIEQLRKFVDDLKSFKEFDFLDYTIKHLEKMLVSHNKMKDVPAVIAANIDKIKFHRAGLHKAILSSDSKTATSHKNELDAMLAQSDHHVDAPTLASSHLGNSYTETPTFFGSTALLSYLGDEEYEAIEKIDFSKPLYTAVGFPKRDGQDSRFWHYIVYFLVNLKTSSEPIEIERSEDFRVFSKVKYGGNENFEKLSKIVDQYLHSNSKALIPEIMELVELVPEIKEANDKRKKQITTVYRGLGFGEEDTPSEEEIEAEDRKRKYVATSESRYAAKNFALQKGHLDRDRNSAVGYIIEYAVDASSVVLDTKVIQTIFNESEIIIDATKATITEITEV